MTSPEILSNWCKRTGASIGGIRPGTEHLISEERAREILEIINATVVEMTEADNF